ncbi:hypothetical protein HYH03_016424 [Edaphochlamys debaryana]|uniref:Uncharacterized protein n=1 Tax=Edaphochlamys debaryana TaxID=47281 RepID=A0A835XJZ1_9CHLO|nr:hypothetical protein HYH03_016424 [Edaphochlamys debaryana]|eukprot:KAG2484770.1 hypothetical protein HYH03_016424 [Edaphochlamys debaryana]
MGLITRLPELTTLVLEVLAPDPGDDSLDQAVLMHALSQLPCLTDLTVADSYFLPSIPDCLARQLTRLAVKLPDDVVDSPTADLEAYLPRSIALRELVVEAKHDGVLEEADVRQLLDASPPSLASVQVALVGPSLLAFSCELAGGVLSSVSIGGLASADLPPYDAVAAVLAMAVLPSRVLGPRLPLLKLEGLSLASGTSVPGPALELLSRCDRIDVNTLAAGPSAEHTYGVVRLLGLPRKLLWEAYPGALGTVLLRGPRPGEPASRNGGGGGGVGGAAGAVGRPGGGRGRGRQGWGRGGSCRRGRGGGLCCERAGVGHSSAR